MARVSQEEISEDDQEKKARPTKAGDYRKPFTPFSTAQKLFKEDMDAFDREKRDTTDPKTIGQRTKIVQEWWGSLFKDKKGQAAQASDKWNKLGAPKEMHEGYVFILFLDTKIDYYINSDTGEKISLLWLVNLLTLFGGLWASMS